MISKLENMELFDIIVKYYEKYDLNCILDLNEIKQIKNDVMEEIYNEDIKINIDKIKEELINVHNEYELFISNTLKTHTSLENWIKYNKKINKGIILKKKIIILITKYKEYSNFLIKNDLFMENKFLFISKNIKVINNDDKNNGLIFILNGNKIKEINNLEYLLNGNFKLQDNSNIKKIKYKKPKKCLNGVQCYNESCSFVHPKKWSPYDNKRECIICLKGYCNKENKKYIHTNNISNKEHIINSEINDINIFDNNDDEIPEPNIMITINELNKNSKDENIIETINDMKKTIKNNIDKIKQNLIIEDDYLKFILIDNLNKIYYNIVLFENNSKDILGLI